MDTTQISEGTQFRDSQTTLNARKSGSFGSFIGKPIQNRQKSGSPAGSTDSLGPLTAITDNMTDTDVDRVIKDAREADRELYIKDSNGKVVQNFENTTYGGEEDNKKNSKAEISKLELISNLSSSTEIEQETKNQNLRRSKRLSKTNPIVRP